jgi:hypothetical protein
MNRVVVPARQTTKVGGIDFLESIPGLLKSLKIPSQAVRHAQSVFSVRCDLSLKCPGEDALHDPTNSSLFSFASFSPLTFHWFNFLNHWRGPYSFLIIGAGRFVLF